MKVAIRHRCPDHDGYRSARVRSLFNVDEGAAGFAADFELDLDAVPDWRIGLVVGPSGSGKTSLGRRILGPTALHRGYRWPRALPVVEAIAPAASFDDATAALSAVGLGSVPAWLRPFAALSNGERFRAELARILLDAPDRVVIDEFTSVVDRQVAKVGAHAFAKAWRRSTGGRCVLLSCHRDIVEWIQPDWTLDTTTGDFVGRSVQPRPPIPLRIHPVDGSWWPRFEPHHYLKLPRLIAAEYYLGTVAGEPVAHVGVTTRPGLKEARAARFVVMPDWQGVGIGKAFLSEVCRYWATGRNRHRIRVPTLLNTSHPGLCRTLRGDPRWQHVSSTFHGDHKSKSAASIARTTSGQCSTGYGGHFRATNGFRYWGPP